MANALDRYRSARDGVVAALSELDAALEEHPLTDLIERLQNGRFVLAVVGEFSSGKSFLLNALLGKVTHEERAGAKRIVGLLATDINPSTATITELSYATEDTATAYYPNGREERIPLGRLARFVAVGEENKLHDATADENGSPSLVRIGVDSAFLNNGFVVADTPGLASINPAHRRATLSYLPGADAVLYLIDTQQPFTDGDASFLGIVRRYIESIFIVQTKIDLWRMRDGTREAWQNASSRILAQAAIHAPNTPVFPLSARDYAEGVLTGDDDLIAQSRFGEFLSALDASLVATTGRSRLRRAAATARRLAGRAGETLTREAAALETDAMALRARRDAIVPALAVLDAGAAAADTSFGETASALHDAVVAQGASMRAEVTRTLARAFDITDIARLRDRGKLHIIVDDTLASAIGRFAGDIAELVAQRVRGDAKTAVDTLMRETRDADVPGNLRTLLETIAAERLPITEDAALAFDADAGSGAWSTDIETGLRSTVVLGALGGPAVGLVSAIAARFAAHQAGSYMKRELLADLGATLFAEFDTDLARYVEGIAARVGTLARSLGARIATLAPRVRHDALASIEIGLAAHTSGIDRAAAASKARERATTIAAIATRIETIAETFARESRADRAEHADPAVPLDPAAGTARVAEAARFDPQTYEHGLNPERWRIAVVGAFKRGKSSLINTIAGERILGDEGSEIEMRFPVHVRYGPQTKAYALGDDAAWDPIAIEAALDAATRTPVLIETPWRLPKQLVLVHTPAFDSGFALAENIVFAAAERASEILALFSRQLSDRELELYGRLGELGKPMTFVHTIADHEEPTERRNVVMLADRYLRERAIVPQRIFTTSTIEYRAAREAQRAPAGWNELTALVSTLEAHAEEHMAHLERSERERTAGVALGANRIKGDERPPSFLGRLFGRR